MSKVLNIRFIDFKTTNNKLRKLVNLVYKLPIAVNIFRVTVVLKIWFFLSASAVILNAIENNHIAKYGKADKKPFYKFIRLKVFRW